MSVHRARTNCPLCNKEEEVWFYNSDISPVSFIECENCRTVFEADQYISSLIELYQNVTVSASQEQFTAI